MTRKRLPAPEPDDKAASGDLDQVVLDLLSRLPLTWEPLDPDKLTATEQEALKLLTAGELVERRFIFRLRLIGHTSAVEARITATGEQGLLPAVEPVMKAAWKAFAGEYLKGKAGAEQDQPTFLCERTAPEEARLTQEGQKARQNVAAGNAKMVLDFLYRRGPVFAGKVVPGYGRAESVRTVTAPAAPVQVEIVNTGPLAAIAKMMQKWFAAQAKAPAGTTAPAAGGSVSAPVPPVPEKRCHAMKKSEIAARILNRTNVKDARPREVARKLEACKLRDEGNGKWTIILDTVVLTEGELARLSMTEWPPPPKVK